MDVSVKIVRSQTVLLFPYKNHFLSISVGIGYRLFLVNFSNLTSPGNSFLIASINQTIINITRGAVIATNIIISPSGEVTLVVTGRNYSIPELELALLNRANSNWTAGPYLVTYNRTDLIPIQSEFNLFSLVTNNSSILF